jgi:hypothetical protein
MSEPQIILSGTVVIACQHGVDKAKIKQLYADYSRENVAECQCCFNLFAYESKRMHELIMFCEKCGGSKWQV